jgi:hypothetical protein
LVWKSVWKRIVGNCWVTLHERLMKERLIFERDLHGVERKDGGHFFYNWNKAIFLDDWTWPASSYIWCKRNEGWRLNLVSP